MSLFTPSGGLVYHLRALRYGATLWRPFREVIGEWLVHHLPPDDELVLVGPSGGAPGRSNSTVDRTTTCSQPPASTTRARP